MEAKNLRMGNFVYYLAEDDDNKSIKYIDKIDGTDIHQMQDDAKYAKSHEPILITEKWLINLGFNKFPGSGQLFDTDDFWAGRLINGGYFEINHLELKLKYVHDLQNLFFAITGRELELKNEC